ncbi:ATP-binding protein [Nitrospirillum sp. BR 11163]|uniref:sensor histidine kinase n=1 Tax=Nitrospirillum sp. BR 11163 TaxID=3104323 RepID=UPI002AFE661F|nr:ATP-binding protein [Nitrospirillum sp. BR 11163]MEA1674338.1 ATP-binding protein [Nitrospirillum sp. BR 11163]
MARKVLLILVATVLLLLGGGLALFIRLDHDQQYRQQRAFAREMAQAMTRHTRATIAGTDAVLAQVANLVTELGGLDGLRTEETWRRLKLLSASLPGGVYGPQSLWIVDATGHPVLSTTAFPAPAIDVTDRDYFRVHKAGRDGVYVGPAILTRLTQQVAFTVSRPLKRPDGAFAGVLMASLSTSELMDFAELIAFDRNPLLGIYQSDGRVVGRRPDMIKHVGQTIADGPLIKRELSKAPSGLFESMSPLDRRVRIAAYDSLPDFGLVILAGVDRQVVMQGWRDRSMITAGFAAVAALAILVLTWGALALLGRHEAQRRQLAQALNDRAREEAQRRAAEAAANDRAAFLANLSHELRTPLTAVIGYSSLMAAETLGPLGSGQYRDHATAIRDSGRHLLTLINDILDHAKAEAGQVALKEAPVDLAATARFALEVLAPKAREGGVLLSADIDAPARWLTADETRLKQILINVLTNAVKFTPAGGSVAVRASLGGGGDVVLRVEDTGIGIAPEDQARVLEPFQQVAGQNAAQGTGLGLPLTKRLVELHGGTLRLFSAPGVGTVVEIRLPGGRVMPATHEEAITGPR